MAYAVSANSSLAGKVALLTGASSVLGRAFALALAKAGASVFLVARREESLRDTVAAIARGGGEASYHVADLRTVPALYDLVDVLLARYKKLHILIHNARVRSVAPIEELKRSEVAEMIETNLAAPIYLTQACLEALRRSAPADIVSVVPEAGLRGAPHGAGYCAVEHGVTGFSRALAQELAADRIRVTTICAASLGTDVTDGSSPAREGTAAIRVEPIVASLMNVLASPPSVTHGEIVLKPTGA